jgi:hypothetical protein
MVSSTGDDPYAIVRALTADDQNAYFALSHVMDEFSDIVSVPLGQGARFE